MATSTTTAPKPGTTTDFKNGDSVQVTARDQSAADIKSGLYFKHYANLYGTILKVYGEEASVLVNRDSLSTEIRERHEAGEKAMRKKWLDGLSEEGRNRLSAREKDFGLNYAILVSTNDLKPFDLSQAASAVTPGASEVTPDTKAIAKAASALDPATGESDVTVATEVLEAGQSGSDSSIKRLSESQLAAAEEAHLAERTRATRKNGKS